MPIEHAYQQLAFAGQSASVARLRVQVARIAPHFRIALLVGEPGTGVEAVARRMHSLSPAAQDAFRCMQAGKLVSGAPVPGGGVLFLTGLDDLEPQAQARLLPILQSIAKDTRILIGSQADPRGMVASGRLRAELYERIGTLEIRIAPLRERIDDLPELLENCAVFGERAAERLRRYPWPRNLQELAEVKRRVCGLGRIVEPADLQLPEEIVERSVRLDEVIERHVVQVLERVGGNKLRAAEMLGISRSTLYRMLEGVGA